MKTCPLPHILPTQHFIQVIQDNESDHLWKAEITHKAGNIHIWKSDHEEEMPQIPNTDVLTPQRHPRQAGQMPAKHPQRRKRLWSVWMCLLFCHLDTDSIKWTRIQVFSVKILCLRYEVSFLKLSSVLTDFFELTNGSPVSGGKKNFYYWSYKNKHKKNKTKLLESS